MAIHVLLRRARAAAIGAAAMAAVACWAQPERTIVYANVGGERVARAFEKLLWALERRAALERHGARLVHVVIREHDAAGLAEDLRRIVAMRPAAIVATSSVIARAARDATATIPVVFGSWQNPVEVGLVESFARPGRNLTGFSSFVPLEQKHLELLTEWFPGVRRVGVVADAAWVAQSHVAAALAEARARFAIDIEVFAVATERELERALATARARAVDGWYVTHTTLPFEHPDFVVARLERERKPVVYARSQYVARGGLLAYQADLGDVFEIWARLLDRILSGVPPAIIPIEGPRHFELAVNLEAAHRLGVEVPRPILVRADRIH